jgi:ABC-type methionine transport system ATPase subunit
MLTFTQELISEPVIYNLSQQFNVITNIHRADVSEEKGWIILEMEGKEDDIEQGIAWVTSKGVRVEPVGEDTAEG